MSKSYTELKTVRDLIRYAVSSFTQANLSFGHGTSNAWDEAVYLVLHKLNLPLDTLEPFLDARVLDSERNHVIDLIHRRVEKRVPLAYLTGIAWLQGYKFYADKRVIVPRSPISELLAEQLSPWIADPDEPLHILDMCTGSGCLAILAAIFFPNATVDGVDISPYAAILASRNVDLYNLKDRVHIYESDLFETLNKAHKYDIILCNPPYVNTESMKQLTHEYQAEPKLALCGGKDGMKLIRRFLKEAPDYMNEDSLLVLEIGHEYEHFLHAFPTLEPTFLDTAEASQQIVLLRREQLLKLDIHD